MDKIRVLRIISYEGPRDKVEEILTKSIHGERKLSYRMESGGYTPLVTIQATTLGEFPEILTPFEKMSEEELDREKEKLEIGLAIIRTYKKGE